MPIMPRTSGKCRKIAEDILGKKPKKTNTDKESTKERKLNSEESSKAK
jgi:hypothetical protein